MLKLDDKVKVLFPTKKYEILVNFFYSKLIYIVFDLITNKLNVNSKMTLYQAAEKRELNDFKKLITREFPLFEEISASNFYLTPLHYAIHYGKMEIAFYILDTLKDQGKYRMAMESESNDHRTSVLCLLKSNTLSLLDKMEYFIKLLQRYEVYPDERSLREIKNTNLDDIYKLFKEIINKLIILIKVNIIYN